MRTRERFGARARVTLVLGLASLGAGVLAQQWLSPPLAAALTALVVAGTAWLGVDRIALRPLRRRLAASESRLAALVEAADVVMWTSGADAMSDLVSPGWLAYTGQSVGECRKEGWRRAIHPDDLAAEIAAWDTAIRTGAPFRLDYRVWHAGSGAWRWNSERAVPLRTAGGEVEGWLGVLLDIDDRHRAEELLRASEERYRQLVEQSRDGIWFMAFDPPIPIDLPEEEFVARYLASGTLLECNDAFARAYDHERAEQLLGKSNADLLAPDDPANREMVRRFYRGGFVLPRWKSIEMDRNGRRRVMDSTVSGICRDGALVAEWGIQRDITAESAARDELEDQRRWFQSVLDNVPIGISVKDPEGRYQYINEAQLRLIGWHGQGYQGRSTLDLPDTAHARRMRALEERLLATGEPVRGHADTTEYLPGEVRSVLMTKSLLHDASGRVTGITTCEFDVTELEATRHALSRSEQRWRRVFEATPVAMELYDANGDFIEGNPASYALFGTPTPGARQVNMFEDFGIESPTAMDKLRAGLTVRWEGWYDFEHLAEAGFDTRGRSGQIYINSLMGAVDDATGAERNYIIICVDDSDRRAFEEAMQESEARYRRFLEHSHEGIFRIEFEPPVPLEVPLEERIERFYASARLAECNDALARQHGHADSEALMRWLGGDLGRLVCGDCAAMFLAADCRLRDAIITTRHRDGSQVLLRLNAVGEIVDGHLVREWGVAEDVTRAQQVEAERRQQQALLTAIVETVPVGITVKDTQGRYTYVNRWLCEALGCDLDAMLGKTVHQIPGAADAMALAALDQSVLASGKPAPEFRTHVERVADGTRIEVLERKAPILDEQGRAIGVVTSLMDVGPLEEIRRALEEERTLLQAVLDTAPVSITLKDAEGRYRYVNQRAREVSRWGEAKIEGRTAADVDNPRYASDVLALDRQVLATGEAALGVEVGGRDPTSGETWALQLHKAPLRDARGRVTGLVSCTLDISERKRAEQELESQRSLFASVLDALPMGVSLRDRARRFRYVNRWWRERFGFDPALQSGLTIEEITPIDDSVDMDALDREVLEHGTTVTDIEASLSAADGGDLRYGLVSKLPLRNAEGAVDGIIICTVDITERRRAEQLLLESEKRYRLLYDDNPSMFFTIDERGTLLQVNDFGARQLGYRAQDLVGTNIADLHEGEDRELMLANLAACFAEPERMHRWEMRRVRRDGEALWVRETVRTVNGEGGRPVALTVCEDISETRSLSQELSWQASHDALTGLVNRREFERRLALALESARGAGLEHTLCYIDLDQFKVINDTCGHVAGDELLRQLGALFESRVRHQDTLARLGGDEFGLLMIDCGLGAGERVCRGLRDALEEFRFLWEDNSFRIGSSMGLVQVDANTGAVSEVLGAADAACYAAKERGPNRIHVYRRDDAELVRRRDEMAWVSRIELALDEQRLSLAFQHITPLLDTDSGAHYELLLRMRDEHGRPVSPGDFLPAAERYGLATRLDRFVVKTAAEWLGAHPEHVEGLFLCCINLSGKTLSAEDFPAFVSESFRAAGVPLDRICFEITETAAIANLAHATRFIEELHEQGCRFALDDFGSGLSSFAYLKSLPVDFLKIDGMFVRDIDEDPIDLAMVRSISEIGHVMGKRTIAEFVESAVVLERLREMGVDYAQGYHLSRPAPLAGMETS